MEQITETKKITANDTIVQMLYGINGDKKDLFYKAASDYVSTLAINGTHYHRIKTLINNRPIKFIQLDNLSNDIKKLLNKSIVGDDNVFLNEKTKSLIDELILEYKNADTYKYYNLGVRNKILFHGSTGNGKTTIAKHIARLTDLPLVEINSDNIIDSKIGNTGYNINQIFNNIKEPCVLFWDEIDTIGRKRTTITDSAAATENERMVNSVLVNIEKLSNDVIFIGSTNRKEVLDIAFLRRFDIQFEIEGPTEIEKEKYVKRLSEYYNLPEMYPIDNISQYTNYSDIKLYFVDLARKFVAKSIK